MKRNKKLKGIFFFCAVVIFLVLCTAYYLFNQSNLGRRSENLVGDGLCGNLKSETDQDVCCQKFHENDVHVECVGNWKYLSGENLCDFVCETSFPSCTEELRICDDGKLVSRNASKECEFDSC